MAKIAYNFFYTSSEIVDHDDDGAVMEEVKNYLGAFFDLNNGLEYYQYKYPDKKIKYETVQIMDAEE